jgi:hypothetical protein
LRLSAQTGACAVAPRNVSVVRGARGRLWCDGGATWQCVCLNGAAVCCCRLERAAALEARKDRRQTGERGPLTERASCRLPSS